MNDQDKDLEYWRKNAEEDYKQVPISVLRYIAELEIAVSQVNKNESISLVSDFYLLKEGDIIREGDEFANGYGWSKTGVVNERYNERHFKPHRRRITNCR